MAEFYKNLEIPIVERLARAMCGARGINPDTLVAESGYPNAEAVPIWWKYQDRAWDTLSVLNELKLVNGADLDDASKS